MEIEIFADNLTREDISPNQHRSARAIFIVAGKVLLLHTKKYNYYMLPGGNIEPNETPETAVVREVLEETGYQTKIDRKTVIIKEYYADSSWEAHYFIVEQIEDAISKPILTQEETDLDLENLWLELDEALVLLDNHDSSYYKATNVMAREFLALINSI